MEQEEEVSARDYEMVNQSNAEPIASIASLTDISVTHCKKPEHFL
jgi:hypothetical protein